MTRFAYVGLGSNLGHPRRRLARALTELARLPRSELVAASRNYLTAPVGAAEPQPDYINAVAALRTALGRGAIGAQSRIATGGRRVASDAMRRAFSTSICCCSASADWRRRA
jgi:2-amino-4-hydroxy-6-hydroxymethyldihydropteridine diphosphokinase